MDDYTYYYCYRDCNLCDGYDWMGPNPPEGCLIEAESRSPGLYCCMCNGRAVCYVNAENPEEALEKSKKKIKAKNLLCYKGETIEKLNMIKVLV